MAQSGQAFWPVEIGLRLTSRMKNRGRTRVTLLISGVRTMNEACSLGHVAGFAGTQEEFRG